MLAYRTDKSWDSQAAVQLEDQGAWRVLAGWLSSAVGDGAVAWLERASYAIEQRNAALHATPVVQLGRPRATEKRLFPGEMPGAYRPYNGRPLTVERSALRLMLENAFSDG